MVLEILEVLSGRDPAAAHLGVAQPRLQLAEHRRQHQGEERPDLEIAVLVQVADVDDALTLGGEAFELLFNHRSIPAFE